MTEEAVEIISNYGGDIYENYSGRGMYGKTTSGIVFDTLQDFISVLGDVMINEESEERLIVGEAISQISTDSMGRGIIIY